MYNTLSFVFSVSSVFAALDSIRIYMNLYTSVYILILRTNVQKHTATHCTILQRIPHCNRWDNSSLLCCVLQHAATHCNTLQHAVYHTLLCLFCWLCVGRAAVCIHIYESVYSYFVHLYRCLHHFIHLYRYLHHFVHLYGHLHHFTQVYRYVFTWIFTPPFYICTDAYTFKYDIYTTLFVCIDIYTTLYKLDIYTTFYICMDIYTTLYTCMDIYANLQICTDTSLDGHLVFVDI